ncbi:WD40 repeat-like protein [Macrolepiota fuliginosa MF-IS2]|uniref:WD40 repeat-like protein n=1 Tax=Macrolepiota fuliginosa MF-IS2 TaxID=1400762 RepID=A0A9P5X4L0_9AGAR|nr:WD40 repeat-like protein [Macrolepiota fuliginosa MF-IS2]
MPGRPHKVTQKDSQDQELTAQSTPTTETQHGNQHQPLCLLDIPAEILAGITSYLDPPSLQNLGLVNKSLSDHVNDDGTWHRAFVQQFLGIDFQSELYDCQKRLLLRREAKSWKQEFITRFHLCRKWVLSRNSTVRHIPVHSAISSMHLMPTQSALLCASTVYGIVSRSLPLTGKILSGYLNPTGPRVGIGIGNPNVEFAPNVSTCILASDGGTIKVLWGTRHGEVTLTVANKAIDLSRRGVNFELTRCFVDDEHEGPVLDATWDDRELAATGGTDGCIKLWDTQTMSCLWTSERQSCNLVTDPVIKVASAVATRGIVVGCMRSGNIVVFKGFEEFVRADTRNGKDLDFLNIGHSIQAIAIPCPVKSSTPGTQTITSLHIDNNTSLSHPTLLVAYENDAHFYRITVGAYGDEHFRADVFGDTAFGPISCISPFFATRVGEHSFILVGDRIGCISIYDWHSLKGAAKGAILPVRRFEAHDNGSTVTAIHWNGTTLITGSSNGTTHIFDGLTFEPLRSFSSPTPRFRGREHAPPANPNDDGRVRQILVNPDKDVMIANVGNAVIAWKAGPIGKSGSGGVRGRVPLNSGGYGRKKHHGGKWLHQVEWRQNIAESRHLLEQESKKSRVVHGKAKEHQASLDQLGLSEQEALEYVMMLSREETVRNAGTDENSVTIADPSHSKSLTDRELSMAPEEGTFETDETPSDYRSSRNSGNDPTSLSASSSNSSSYENDEKYLPSSLDIPPSTSTNDQHFPPIGDSPTPVSTPGPGSSSAPRANTRSPRSSAWNIPLRTPTASPPSLRSASSIGSSPGQGRAGLPSPQPASAGDDFDEDLRLAIELSLAEARSQGNI